MTSYEFELEVRTRFEAEKFLAEISDNTKSKPPSDEKFKKFIEQIKSNVAQQGAPVTPEELGWDK